MRAVIAAPPPRLTRQHAVPYTLSCAAHNLTPAHGAHARARAPTSNTHSRRPPVGRYAELIMPAGIHFKVVAAPQNLAKAIESRDWK